MDEKHWQCHPLTTKNGDRAGLPGPPGRPGFYGFAGVEGAADGAAGWEVLLVDMCSL